MKQLINTLTLFVFLSSAWSSIVVAQEVALPNIKQTCDELVSSCSITLKTADNRLIEILTDHPWRSEIIHHSETLIEIKSSCGSPCSFSSFVDLKSEKFDTIHMPVVFSNRYNLVAFTDGNLLKIKPLFNNNTSILKADFSPVAALTSAIKNAEFFSDSELSLTYLSGKNYKSKTKIFDFHF